MAYPCIFCRSPLDEPNEEHVIPKSFGGTVTISSVCRKCNSSLGRDVDSVTNDELIQSLREEAGLRTRKTISASFDDPEVGKVAVHLRASGGYVVPTQVFKNDQGEITILADSNDEAAAHARRMTDIARERGKDQEFRRPNQQVPRVLRVEIRPLSKVPLDGQLDRLACKIAIDFVALVGGPAVALDPRLDLYRHGALHGGVAVAQGDVTPPDTQIIFLPITGRLFPWRHSSENPAPSIAELYEKYVDDEGQLRQELPGIAHLENIYHEVTLHRSNGRGLLQIVLFGVFFLELDLPPDLNIPWEKVFSFKLNVSNPARLA